MTTYSSEKPATNLDLHVQPVADFAVRVCSSLDFPVEKFLDEHKEDIHSVKYTGRVLVGAVIGKREQ